MASSDNEGSLPPINTVGSSTGSTDYSSDNPGRFGAGSTAAQNRTIAALGQNTQTDRGAGVPELVMYGGAGDKDYRMLGYGSRALKHHVLVTRGLSGQQMNSLALNFNGQLPTVGQPALALSNGTSGVSNIRVRPGQPDTDVAIENVTSGGGDPITCKKLHFPDQVGDLAALPHDESVRLEWTVPAVPTDTEGTDSYVFWVKKGPPILDVHGHETDEGFVINSQYSVSSSGSVFYYISGLTNGQLYSFRIAGINCRGQGKLSVTRTATPNAGDGSGGSGTLETRCVTIYIGPVQGPWTWHNEHWPVSYPITNPELQREGCNNPGNPPYYGRHLVGLWLWGASSNSLTWSYGGVWWPDSNPPFPTHRYRADFNNPLPNPPEGVGEEWDGT